MNSFIQKNKEMLILALALILAYVWDQDRRSYTLIPDIGVEISTNCHFVEVSDLRFCRDHSMKVSLADRPETGHLYLVVLHGTNGDSLSSIYELNYLTQTINLPKDTGNVYLTYTLDH